YQWRYHDRALDGWRRSHALSGPARHGARRQGGLDVSDTALDAQDTGKSRRPSDRSFRWHTRRGCGRSVSILSRTQPAVLRREPVRLEGVAGRQGGVLDLVDAGRVEGYL